MILLNAECPIFKFTFFYVRHTPRPFVVGTQASANTTPSNTLTVQQSGDQSGGLILTLQNRDGLSVVSTLNTNGSSLRTDLVMQTAIPTTSLQQRYIRLEARSDRTQCGVPESQIGPVSKITLFLGDNYAYSPKPFLVGTQATANTTPSNTLTVNGTLACSGRMTGKMFLQGKC